MQQSIQSTLGVSPIDRHAEIRRNQDEINSILNSNQSEFLIWIKGRILFDRPDSLFFSYQQVSELSDSLPEPIYLGKNSEKYYFAYQLAALPQGYDDSNLTNLRSISLIADEEELGLLFHSQGLFNWHRNHQYCAACGSKTKVASTGHSRVCLNQECGKEHFPRIDPAVIFTIVDKSQTDDRLLLARQASWDEGRYSIIAGFVEPGESLENAVFREAYEEVGLSLQSTNYVASQPWPFPSSMMVGFEAVTETNEITLIDKELEHAMWVSADEIVTQIESGKLKLPYSISISWHLIERWFTQQTGRSLSTIAVQES